MPVFMASKHLVTIFFGLGGQDPRIPRPPDAREIRLGSPARADPRVWSR
jgi:hypothetical protein